MLKADKERIVAELTEKLRSSPTLFVADYRGLSVTEIDDLRTKVIEHGARFTVVKNTLTRRAAEAAGADSLLAMLEGPTAIAFIEADGDMVAVAKALADSARETKILAIRGGILDGSPIGEDDVKNLATLPPLDVLRGQVIGGITAPLMTVVGLIAAPMRDLLGLIDARIEQLSEGLTPEGSDPAGSAGPAEATGEPAPEGLTPEGSDPAGNAGPAEATGEPAAEGLTPEGSDPAGNAGPAETTEGSDPAGSAGPAETAEGSDPEGSAEPGTGDDSSAAEAATEEPTADATTDDTGETEEAAEEAKEE